MSPIAQRLESLGTTSDGVFAAVGLDAAHRQIEIHRKTDTPTTTLYSSVNLDGFNVAFETALLGLSEYRTLSNLLASKRRELAAAGTKISAWGQPDGPDKPYQIRYSRQPFADDQLSWLTPYGIHVFVFIKAPPTVSLGRLNDSSTFYRGARLSLPNMDGTTHNFDR